MNVEQAPARYGAFRFPSRGAHRHYCDEAVSVVVARHTSLISSSNEMTFTERRVDRSKNKISAFGSEREREIGTESDSEREIRVNDLL